MTDDQKQKMKEYQKKYRETKKLNNKNKQNFDLIINGYNYFLWGFKILKMIYDIRNYERV